MRRRVQAALAPGAVKVRIRGDIRDARAVAALLIATSDVELIEEYGPYEDREGPTARLYLLVRLLDRRQS
jgi:hypothetical protein